MIGLQLQPAVTTTPTALEGAAQQIPELLPWVLALVLGVVGMSIAYELGRKESLRSRAIDKPWKSFTPDELSAIIERDHPYAIAISPVDDGAELNLVARSNNFRSGWREVSRMWVEREKLDDVAKALQFVADYLDDKDKAAEAHLDRLGELHLTGVLHGDQEAGS